MEHTSDADSTSSLPDLVDADSDESSITEIPSDDYLGIILPPHTSSLVQPLDTPTWGRLFHAESEQLSDADSTSSLPDLALVYQEMNLVRKILILMQTPLPVCQIWLVYQEMKI